jgi:hypothetical protein
MSNKTRNRDVVLLNALHTGDPLADAANCELEALGEQGKRIMQEGIRSGVAAVPHAPAAMKALLAACEDISARTDREILTGAGRAYLSIDPGWFKLALAAGFLYTFTSPRVARLFVETGKLVERPQRRIFNTTAWYSQCMLPGGLFPGADGYISCLRIRMMHARLRASALRTGWDDEQYGVPINQLDTTRTWVENAHVPYQFLRKLGFDFTKNELAEHYRRWQCIGGLMGVGHFVDAVTNASQAQKVLHEIETISGQPDDNSRTLAAAMLEACAAEEWPAEVNELANATVVLRCLLGDKTADALALPRSVQEEKVPLIAKKNRKLRRWQRANPEQWEALINSNIASYSATSNHHPGH